MQTYQARNENEETNVILTDCSISVFYNWNKTGKMPDSGNADSETLVLKRKFGDYE